MKDFELSRKMLSIRGVFYPTGYAFIMFPDVAHAGQVARELEAGNPTGEHVMLLTPTVILEEIGKLDGHSSITLPQVGTERATVRKYVDLAQEGHHALMVHVHSDDETERMMEVVRKVPFSYAQRYHLLAMEDLK